MTVIASPLDTGGGAIFPVYGSESRGGEREERGGQPIWNGGTGSGAERRDEKRNEKLDGANMCSIRRPLDDAAI